MDKNDLVKLAAALVWAVVVGLLAKRKNRNPWGWGIAGALSWLIALLVLAFLPYKCPKCDMSISADQGKTKNCPSCGSFSMAAPSVSQSPHSPIHPSEKEPTESSWAKALEELDGPARRAGLWAKVFSEASGNEPAARASYLKVRAREFVNEPPAFITELTSNGYQVEFVNSEWRITSPDGQFKIFAVSLTELERKAKHELSRLSQGLARGL